MASDRIPEECEHTECTHEPRHVLTIETEDGLAEEWVCFRHRRRRLQSEDVRPGPKSHYAIADGGQSSTGTERWKCPTCGGRYDNHVKKNGVMGCCPHCGTKVRQRAIQPGQSQLEGFNP